MEFIRRGKRAFDILRGKEEPASVVENNTPPPPPPPPENPLFSFAPYGALAERERYLHDYQHTWFPEGGETYKLIYEHVPSQKIRSGHFDVRCLGEDSTIRSRIYFANARGQVFTLYVLGTNNKVGGFAIDMAANDLVLNTRPMMFYRTYALTDVQAVGPSTSCDGGTYLEVIDGVWTPIWRLDEGKLTVRVVMGKREVEYCLVYIPDAVGGASDNVDNSTPEGRAPSTAHDAGAHFNEGLNDAAYGPGPVEPFDPSRRTTEYIVDEDGQSGPDLSVTDSEVAMIAESAVAAGQREWDNQARGLGLVSDGDHVHDHSECCSDTAAVSVVSLQINALGMGLDIEGDETPLNSEIPPSRVVDRDQINVDHVYLNDRFKKANLTFEIVKCNERMVALLSDGAGRTIRHESIKAPSSVDTGRWDIRRVRYLDADDTIPSKIEVSCVGYLFVFVVEPWDGADRRADDINIALNYLGPCKDIQKPYDYNTNWVSSYPPEKNLGVVHWDELSRTGEKHSLAIPGTDMELATIQSRGSFKIAIIDRYRQCVYVELDRQPTHTPDHIRITRIEFADKESPYPEFINLQWGHDDISLTITQLVRDTAVEKAPVSRTTEY